MGRVTSADGTAIAYERTGSGPAVILVGGGLDDGAENAPLAPEVAERFSVYNYARRGRADSGDTPPYALEREIEDLDAYDAACLGDGRPPAARLATIAQPVLVATGGLGEFFEVAADAIAASLPHAQRLTLDGQTHVADPTAFAPVLERFFRA